LACASIIEKASGYFRSNSSFLIRTLSNKSGSAV
jgi:hypothetical protein